MIHKRLEQGAFAWPKVGCGVKLHDIDQKDGSKIATEGLRHIAEIHKLEARIRGNSPDERIVVSQEQSAPLVADFRQGLTLQRSVVGWTICASRRT